MKLVELRKELKEIGYKVKVTNFSFCKHATFHSLDGRKRPSIFFSQEQRQEWISLHEFQVKNLTRLRVLRENENIIGLLE